MSDSGWDGFTAIDTATCTVIQTYNVGDTQVPGDPGDYNYASTNEGIAISGGNLYFADTGTSNVAVIATSSLDPSNYNPPEKLINVGLFPQDVAVTPDGKQVWVAETGPQTSPSSPSRVSVISTASDTVTAHLPIGGQPSQVAFSPSGATAYVVTADGLWVFSTATEKPVGVIRGLGDPRGIVVSPDGSTLYVTDTQQGTVAVINAATRTVTHTIKVGELPWAAGYLIERPDGLRGQPGLGQRLGDRHRDEPGHTHDPHYRGSGHAGPDAERPAAVDRPEHGRIRDRAGHGHRCRGRRYQPWRFHAAVW